MAAISVAKRATLLFRRSILPGREGFVSVRALSVTSGKRKEESFFSTLFGSQVEKPTDAHSKVLTEKETLYEFEFNDVKPECIEDYVGLVSEFLPKISEDDQFPGELVGAWTTMFGRLDQAIHFWKYRGGFNSVMKAKQYVRENKEYLEFARKRRTMLNNRETQLLHEFTFFGEPEARAPSHIYELRTYHLKPGTLIEWGNNWGQAIQIRQQDDDAVAGLFSQIGELYVVHHIWAYEDLATRQKIRQNMWNRPGWDTCVANTVPLIRRMESRIMIPLPFGPLQ
ncbi:LOW QUALITY PROTEIN: protein NipSnap homolog 1-like [Pocillopora verrucosa]|uniref:NIPSNAP domain-containing protein n=1 Tax=Pocillopora meandrina TaxID=46732 RepID=A0AAU9WE01_9CNID|nr:protein NipSnap homolog 1-like [Pocillopora damicornis]CAH3108504.1 unnamed protein product [Pocillopora meandrina]